jgi:hypothetical protein
MVKKDPNLPESNEEIKDKTIKIGIQPERAEPEFGEFISPIQSNQDNMKTVKPMQQPLNSVSNNQNLFNVNAPESNDNMNIQKAGELNGNNMEKGFEYIPLKICILGVNKELKSTLERFLSHEFNLKIFKTEEQVNNLMIKANENIELLREEEHSILNNLYEGNHPKSKTIINA